MASVIENYPFNLFDSLYDCGVEGKKEEEEGIQMASDPYRADTDPFEDVDTKDCIFSRYSDPLIDVYSVIISPLKVEAYQAFLVYGEICVVGSEGEKIHIYDRPKHHPEIIPSGGPRTLLLTGPEPGVIKMDGQNTIYVSLKVQGLTKKRTGHGRWDVKGQRHVWSAEGSLCLAEPAEAGYHEHKSLTLNGDLVDVEVCYTCMPFARIADVMVTFTHDSHDHARSSSPDAYISGKITAHYDSVIGTNSPSPIILFDKEYAQVHYGSPINLCRSLVCIPSYSSLSLKLGKIVVKEPTEKHEIDFSEDIKFDISGFPLDDKHKFSKNNVHLHVRVYWYTTDKLEILLGEQNNLKGPSTSSIAKSVLSKPIEGWYRIQVLSVFVGHPGKEQVDICGTIAVKQWNDICYVFKKDKGCPENLFSGKAPTLEGLTSYLPVRSYPGDACAMHVKLKGVEGGLVDIDNCFEICEYHYVCFPGKWLNRPLSHVLLGKQGFAALHFILFESAVKATVKILVIFKDSNASCPSGSVNGTLVAQYSNYKYSTNYQRKYWSIDLFQEKNARSLPMDGGITLLSNVVSVPVGSSLILDADLYVRSGSAGTCADHFVKKVEIRIGHDESRIEGRTYDVVVRTEWESGGE